MLNDQFDRQLALLETQLSALATMLLADDPAQVHECSAGVHTLAVACAQLGARAPMDICKPFEPRLRILARDLVVLREQLARRQAYVELSLRLLFPAAVPSATYGKGKGLYDGPCRASGSLRPVVA